MKKITVQYAPTFIRMYKGCTRHLKTEIKEKIALFIDVKNHETLKVHKLKGKFGIHSFSVNYEIRVTFEYENNHTVNLLLVGNHNDVY